MPRGITGRGAAEMTVQRTIGAGRAIQLRADTSSERPIRRRPTPLKPPICAAPPRTKAPAPAKPELAPNPSPTAGVPNNE